MGANERAANAFRCRSNRRNDQVLHRIDADWYAAADRGGNRHWGQVLLGTCTMPTTCGSETPSGSLTIGTIVGDSAADASGTATWARIADSTGLTVVDVDVGVVGSGAVIQMVTNVLVAGGPIAFSSFVFRMT
jgi:hypothetical protein